HVTGVQTCALPIYGAGRQHRPKAVPANAHHDEAVRRHGPTRQNERPRQTLGPVLTSLVWTEETSSAVSRRFNFSRAKTGPRLRAIAFLDRGRCGWKE